MRLFLVIMHQKQIGFIFQYYSFLYLERQNSAKFDQIIQISIFVRSYVFVCNRLWGCVCHIWATIIAELQNERNIKQKSRNSTYRNIIMFLFDSGVPFLNLQPIMLQYFLRTLSILTSSDNLSIITHNCRSWATLDIQWSEFKSLYVLIFIFIWYWLIE